MNGLQGWEFPKNELSLVNLGMKPQTHQQLQEIQQL